MKTIATVTFYAALLLSLVPYAFAAHMPVCKGPVVYAVSADKIYYVKGETQYGHVKGGHYMCQAAANAGGYKKQ